MTPAKRSLIRYAGLQIKRIRGPKRNFPWIHQLLFARLAMTFTERYWAGRLKEFKLLINNTNINSVSYYHWFLCLLLLRRLFLLFCLFPFRFFPEKPPE